MPWISAAVAGGASLLGGFMRNQSSAGQSFNQMAMQDYWLRNRHTMESEDLYRAGLNPILSAGGNPPVPPGSRAEMTDAVTPAVGSALAAKQNQAQIDALAAQAEKARAEANLVNTQERQLSAPERMHEDRVLPHVPGMPLSVDASPRTAFSVGVQADIRRRYHDSHTANESAEVRFYEKLLRQIEVEVAKNYSLSTAKATLERIVQEARRLETGQAVDKATAWLRGEQARQEKVEADISSRPGVRETERAIDAAQGATSAIRNLTPYRRR